MNTIIKSRTALSILLCLVIIMQTSLSVFANDMLDIDETGIHENDGSCEILQSADSSI